MVYELQDTLAPDGQTALNSLRVEFGCHVLKMRSCGLFLWKLMRAELECAKLLAGSCEDLRLAFLKSPFGPRAGVHLHLTLDCLIASLPHYYNYYSNGLRQR